MWNIFKISTLLLLMSILPVSAKDLILKEAMQQGIRITGTVSDNAGNLLPGVTIIVKGTSQGTITESDGAYTIMVPTNSVELVFSYVGFISQEILVGDQRTINVKMIEDSHLIDEVIVVGYGTRVKGELTGSVSNVRGESLQAVPSGDLVKGLSGRLAGVTINDRGGETGLSSSAEGNIRIRGSNTLGDNSPLIIIDGIPRSGISRLSANDIESISVLKDASAAIYGARAANGVIVIQTKRGTKNEANQIRLSSDFGVQMFTRIPEAMNAWEFATYMNEIANRFTTQPPYTQDDITLFKNGSDPITHPSTNWYDEVFKSYAPQSHHNITLSGGTENVQYFVSGDYLNQKGMYRSDVKNYDQFQLRSNIDMTFVKYLKIGFDLSGRFGKDHSIPSTGRVMDRIWRTYPTEAAYSPDGLPMYAGELGQNPVVLSSDASGFLDQEQKVFNSKLSFNFNMDWLLQGISLSGYAAYDFNINSSKQLNKPYEVWRLNKGTGEYTNEVGSDQSWGAITRLSQSNSDYRNSLLHMRLNYLNSFGNHNINAFVAYEQSESLTQYINGVRRNLFSSALPELFAGEEEGRQVGGSSEEAGRVNYFGSISYNYDRKYLIDLTLRRDGSFNFPENKRFGNFPGISIAWVPTNESFIPRMNWLNSLKIRTSWAIMGNDRISSFQYLAKYTLGSNSWSVFGNPATYNQGLDESTFPNKNITWEIADFKNIGFDATLLSNHLNLSFDYFYGKRSKILIQRSASTPGYTAMTLPAENLGKVNNQGVEVTLNYRDEHGDFSYQLGGNFTFNRNKIVYMDEAASVPEWRKQEGYPMNSFVVYESLGIYQTQEEVDKSPHIPGAKPGDLIYKDVNDDGKITSDDQVRKYISSIPEITYGISANLAWKGFELELFFQGQARAGMLNNYTDTGNRFKYLFEQRWTQDNPSTKYPRMFRQSDAYNYASTYHLENASFIRLKNTELAYNLNYLKGIPNLFKDVRLFVRGSNLFTLSPIKYFDPETTSSDMKYFPQIMTITGGITIALQ
jgi:TonB-linked SusC/RagA family outer membrane protein